MLRVCSPGLYGHKPTSLLLAKLLDDRVATSPVYGHIVMTFLHLGSKNYKQPNCDLNPRMEQ